MIDETKTEKLLLRMTPTEKNNIKNNADLLRLPMSSYIMNCVTRKRIVVCDDFPRLIFEVSKIGNNINQIATIANTYGAVSENDILYIRREIKKCYELICGFVDFYLEPEQKKKTKDESANLELWSEVSNTLGNINIRLNNIEKYIFNL